ncbi:MAG: signal peptidase II [Magnetococcales bacterium]|nr:signal peptidase II [Magnetococcales bacterium]
MWLLKPRVLGPLLALVVLLADQITKWWMTALLADRGITLIPGFLDLVLVHNLGAAFGVFTDLPPFWRELLLVGVAALATVAILILLWRTETLWMTYALALVLGGAVGNLIDRLRFGWVVDFIHVHWHDLSWPVFNLADSAITLGIGLLLWDNLTAP